MGRTAQTSAYAGKTSWVQKGIRLIQGGEFGRKENGREQPCAPGETAKNSSCGGKTERGPKESTRLGGYQGKGSAASPAKMVGRDVQKKFRALVYPRVHEWKEEKSLKSRPGKKSAGASRVQGCPSKKRLRTKCEKKGALKKQQKGKNKKLGRTRAVDSHETRKRGKNRSTRKDGKSANE